MSTSGGRSNPRPTLDPEVIVDAALRLAQRPAPTAMSFRALGRELRADPTAVYRHFRDRNELVEAALDRLMLDVVAAVPADAPWRDRLRAAANGYLAAVVSHPVVGAEAGHRTTGGPGELALLEVVLAALVEAGLPPQQVARYYPLLAGYAASMAASQAAHRLEDDRVREASERAWVFRSGFELLLQAVEAFEKT